MEHYGELVNCQRQFPGTATEESRMGSLSDTPLFAPHAYTVAATYDVVLTGEKLMCTGGFLSASCETFTI